MRHQIPRTWNLCNFFNPGLLLRLLVMLALLFCLGLSAPVTAQQHLKMVTWNVCGRHCNKSDTDVMLEVREALKRVDADVVALQEITLEQAIFLGYYMGYRTPQDFQDHLQFVETKRFNDDRKPTLPRDLSLRPSDFGNITTSMMGGILSSFGNAILTTRAYKLESKKRYRVQRPFEEEPPEPKDPQLCPADNGEVDRTAVASIIVGNNVARIYSLHTADPANRCDPGQADYEAGRILELVASDRSRSAVDYPGKVFYPVLMGDFNMQPLSSPYMTLIRSGGFKDAWAEWAQARRLSNPTLPEVDGGTAVYKVDRYDNPVRIDYVFLADAYSQNSIAVVRTKVLRWDSRKVFSDHFPLFAEVEFGGAIV
jgi:endonuclease/exonuclease/phosphatase family metal-dependent hydrolase